MNETARIKSARQNRPTMRRRKAHFLHALFKLAQGKFVRKEERSVCAALNGRLFSSRHQSRACPSCGVYARDPRSRCRPWFSQEANEITGPNSCGTRLGTEKPSSLVTSRVASSAATLLSFLHIVQLTPLPFLSCSALLILSCTPQKNGLQCVRQTSLHSFPLVPPPPPPLQPILVVYTAKW